MSGDGIPRANEIVPVAGTTLTSDPNGDDVMF
jgi:hypothetical protein